MSPDCYYSIEVAVAAPTCLCNEMCVCLWVKPCTHTHITHTCVCFLLLCLLYRLDPCCCGPKTGCWDEANLMPPALCSCVVNTARQTTKTTNDNQSSGTCCFNKSHYQVDVLSSDLSPSSIILSPCSLPPRPHRSTQVSHCTQCVTQCHLDRGNRLFVVDTSPATACENRPRGAKFGAKRCGDLHKYAAPLGPQ